jgi:hypothetical protein
MEVESGQAHVAWSGGHIQHVQPAQNTAMHLLVDLRRRFPAPELIQAGMKERPDHGRLTADRKLAM